MGNKIYLETYEEPCLAESSPEERLAHQAYQGTAVEDPLQACCQTEEKAEEMRLHHRADSGVTSDSRGLGLRRHTKM